MRKKQKLTEIFSIIGFLVCTLALLYPVISDTWNRYRNEQIITSYNEYVEDVIDEKAEKLYKEALDYNKKYSYDGMGVVTDEQYQKDKEYESILNPMKNNMMGYIEIPSIDVKEPIYHYADDDILEKGVGHIYTSSLPIGGKTTHSVLTGHRGLPTQKFFSDLDKLEKESKFYIHILGHTHAYEIYKIETVLPNEVSSLVVEEGRDDITLVTCTPYGINTHRLLVTGKRIPFDETKVKDGEVTTEKHKRVIDPAVYVFFGFMLFIFFMIILDRINKRRRKRVIKTYEKNN